MRFLEILPKKANSQGMHDCIPLIRFSLKMDAQNVGKVSKKSYVQAQRAERVEVLVSCV